MNFPEIRGLIRRRILVNFRAKPEVVRRVLPGPFEPKLLGAAFSKRQVQAARAKSGVA